MPLSRFAEQYIGEDLYQPLVKNAAFGLNTYHVGPTPGGLGGSQASFGLAVGAFPATDGVLCGAGKYLALTVDITAITATGTVTVTIFGYDPMSQKAYVILASAALGAVATTILRVGPTLTAAANLVALDFMPLYWGVGVVVATAAPMTFSLGATQMP